MSPTTRVHDSASVVGSVADKVSGGALNVTDALDLCFIVTAAYGSHLSPQVKFLRYVRDKKLKQSRLGDLFVQRFEWLYYNFSPQVAIVMYRYRFFKRLLKWLLVTPIVYFLMSIFKPSDSLKKKIRRAN
ncbi:MAG: CFI-box-CTERM domain-containing protein [Promethearchaeota archaeon]